ncbi:hypothetical protein PspLS_08441 [Pyricularia sp. CBS 133598]|nr:hypothetical protein PspLS_08441 [Pyricularia sp. CBS 133598]
MPRPEQWTRNRKYSSAPAPLSWHYAVDDRGISVKGTWIGKSILKKPGEPEHKDLAVPWPIDPNEPPRTKKGAWIPGVPPDEFEEYASRVILFYDREWDKYGGSNRDFYHAWNLIYYLAYHQHLGEKNNKAWIYKVDVTDILTPAHGDNPETVGRKPGIHQAPFSRIKGWYVFNTTIMNISGYKKNKKYKASLRDVPPKELPWYAYESPRDMQIRNHPEYRDLFDTPTSSTNEPRRRKLSFHEANHLLNCAVNWYITEGLPVPEWLDKTMGPPYWPMPGWPTRPEYIFGDASDGATDHYAKDKYAVDQSASDHCATNYDAAAPNRLPLYGYNSAGEKALPHHEH